jgi:hypothetical protein
MIQMTETNTGPAFQTVARGVSYYLRTNGQGRYELSSKRLAMATFGQVRHFDTLDQVEVSVKAFAGLSALVSM